jgi:hypothetical protein
LVAGRVGAGGQADALRERRPPGPCRPTGIGSGRETLATGRASSRRRETGRNGAKREVKRTGSEADAVPDQASNGRSPGPRLRGAERSRRGSAKQGDADVRAPAGRRRSEPAAERSAQRNGGRASDAVCGRASLGVRRSALASGAYGCWNYGLPAPAGIGGVEASTGIGAGRVALGGRCAPW